MHSKSAAAPERYSHIDFKPPEAVAKAAERGLEYRKRAGGQGGLSSQEAGKAGIGSGVQRAVNLKNRNNIAPDTIRQMNRFFLRHEKNKSISAENKKTPWKDRGYVAWLLWGGDPGKAWVTKTLKQMDAADEKAKQASRVAASFISRKACIIAAGEFGGNRALLKNRDRNYTPDVRIHHEIRNGVEVLYAKDETTGWIEGMNEFGIGIVNAALMVGHDEQEKKIVKTVGKKSKDGVRILAALEKRTVEEAVESVSEAKGGVRGHTFVSDAKESFLVELTSKHDAIVKRMDPDELYVRTNHGIEYPDAGYTEGDDYVSSVARRERAIKVLDDVQHVDEVAPAVYEVRLSDKRDPNNMVRETDKMRTVTQMVLDLTRKKILFYLLPGKVHYLGYVDDLPDGYEPKIQVDVFKYTDIDGDGDFDVVRRTPKQTAVVDETHHEKKASLRVATRYVLASDNEPTNPSLWEEAKDKAKESYKKWPSAYAVGHALKIYKEEGGKWRKKKANPAPPTFVTYEDALAWVSSQAEKHGGMKAFTSAPEYKAVYPQIEALYRMEKTKSDAKVTQEADKAGVYPGQEVEFHAVGPYLSEIHLKGQVVMSKGVPHVRIEPNPHTHRKMVRWNSSWRSVLEEGGQPSFRAAVSRVLARKFKMPRRFDKEHCESKTCDEMGFTEKASCRPYKNCYKTASVGKHTLPPLPYAYDALEPHISEETLRFHHDKHHKAYVDGLNKAEKQIAKAREDEDWEAIPAFNLAMEFNAGGHILHDFYWKSLIPTEDYEEPSDELVKAIEADFGSWDSFRAQLKESTIKVRGSGWGVLVSTPDGLRVLTVMNHENGVLWDGSILLPVDAWEHAYYLDHQNDREAHFDAVFDNLVNWAEVELRLGLNQSGSAKVARGKAKKDVGHGGLDEWFSGHGEGKGKAEGEARWGDWIAISPIRKTITEERADGTKKKVTYEPGDIIGPCAVSGEKGWREVTNDGKDPLKCMPRQKAYDMPKAERAELAREKMKAEKSDRGEGKKTTLTRTFEKEAARRIVRAYASSSGYGQSIFMAAQALKNVEKVFRHIEDDDDHSFFEAREKVRFQQRAQALLPDAVKLHKMVEGFADRVREEQQKLAKPAQNPLFSDNLAHNLGMADSSLSYAKKMLVEAYTANDAPREMLRPIDVALDKTAELSKDILSLKKEVDAYDRKSPLERTWDFFMKPDPGIPSRRASRRQDRVAAYGQISDLLHEVVEEGSSIWPPEALEGLPFVDPPSDDSDQTASELLELEDLRQDRDQNILLIESFDQDFLAAFVSLCALLGVHCPEEQLDLLVEEAKPIILSLKQHYDRSRPFQLGIVPIESDTTQTPSYPSGHTTQARLLALYLSKLHPAHAAKFMRLSEIIAESRLMAGVHFRSDNEYAYQVADYLFKAIPQSFLRTATKTDGERQDEEAERLIAPAPKKKPPRKDLKRRRVEPSRSDDPDAAQDRKDRSQNYKDARLKVSPSWLVDDPDDSDPDQADRIWDLYSLSYGTIGSQASNPKDLFQNFDLMFYRDLDGDQTIDTFVAFKKTPSGSKIVMMGSDGTSSGKRAAIAKSFELLGKTGWYAELSGKPAQLALANGLVPIKDEQVVRDVLKKPLTWKGDGAYERMITGLGSHEKYLFGKPKST